MMNVRLNFQYFPKYSKNNKKSLVKVKFLVAICENYMRRFTERFTPLKYGMQIVSWS